MNQFFTGKQRRLPAQRAAAVLVLALSIVRVPEAISADFTINREVSRVAFGSCSIPGVAQPVWQAVSDTDPDLWIWAGDIIYADTMTDVSRFRKQYAMQNAYDKYRAIRESMLVLGTWDDHDYGANNAGKEYPLKAASQQALLDFLGEPATSVRRSRKGVYASYLIGSPGKRLKILLLDVRFHRDKPGPQADMLGAAQWDWLEAEMRNWDSSLVLIVSGTAVLSTEHKAEKWADYPLSRQRLLRVIQSSQSPVVILSGDLHFAEISRITLPQYTWPLPEITSSGMTHSANGTNYPSSIRVGQLYYGLNFGLVNIEWGLESNTVRLEVRDTDGVVRASETLVFEKSPKKDQ